MDVREKLVELICSMVLEIGVRSDNDGKWKAAD